MTKNKALDKALKFIEVNHFGGPDAFELITAIKQALAAPTVQEPVAWVERWYGSGQEHGWWVWEKHSLTHGQAVAWIGNGPFAERLTSIIVEKHNAALFSTEPVKEPFAPDPHGASGPTPPAAQRQWIELTDEEIEPYYAANKPLIKWVEAKLKEKNT